MGADVSKIRATPEPEVALALVVETTSGGGTVEHDRSELPSSPVA